MCLLNKSRINKAQREIQSKSILANSAIAPALIEGLEINVSLSLSISPPPIIYIRRSTLTPRK